MGIRTAGIGGEYYGQRKVNCLVHDYLKSNASLSKDHAGEGVTTPHLSQTCNSENNNPVLHMCCQNKTMQICLCLHFLFPFLYT